MKIPTISQFNAWPEKDKLWWIDYETSGAYRKMRRSKGYFPLLVYVHVNVGIVYQVNEKGELTEAVAMTVKEAIDRLQRFERASKAMTHKN